MRIVVCIKGVPSDNWEFHYNEDNKMPLINEYQINSYDEYAIEEALRLAEQIKGDNEVVLLTCGPEAFSGILEIGLGMGGNRSIHIIDNQQFNINKYEISCALTEIIKNISPDIVLMGKHSADYPSHQVAAMVANMTEYALATDVVKITEINETFLEVLRLVERGNIQKIKLERPVVLSVTKGINDPRYPSFKNVMIAKKKKTDKYLLKNLLKNYDLCSKLAINKIFELPAKQCKYIKGNTYEISKELIKILNNR